MTERNIWMNPSQRKVFVTILRLWSPASPGSPFWYRHTRGYGTSNSVPWAPPLVGGELWLFLSGEGSFCFLPEGGHTFISLRGETMMPSSIWDHTPISLLWETGVLTSGMDHSLLFLGDVRLLFPLQWPNHVPPGFSIQNHLLTLKAGCGPHWLRQSTLSLMRMFLLPVRAVVLLHFPP